VVGGGSANAGAAASFSEVDAGTQTGARLVLSPEADADYRLRTSSDTLLETETFNYTVQNTGKHNYLTTVVTATWTVGGILTNAGASTAAGGARVRTYAYFPLLGAVQTYVEFTASFNAAVAPSNCQVDIGSFLDSGASPYAPTDGAYFRSSPAGFLGVIVQNGGPETTVGPFTGFTVVPNRKYRFTIVIAEQSVQYWIDDVLYGVIGTPLAAGQPFASVALPFAISQGHIGVTGGVYQATLSDCAVTVCGPEFASSMGSTGNRIHGAYQTLSGAAAPGQLAQWGNAALPAAGTPTNIAAVLGSGLGGLFQQNAVVTGATDLIISSFQVPAGTVAIQGRRLVIRGVRISATNTVVAVAGTATVQTYCLYFGNTAVSLATAEAAATKGPRRIGLGTLSWPIGALAGAPPTELMISVQLSEPVYVNPGEFVGIAMKPILGTATATEVFLHNITFDYSWE
jgi:hypothetical protein